MVWFWTIFSLGAPDKSIDNLNYKDLHSQPPIEKLSRSDRDLYHQSSIRTTFEWYGLPYPSLRGYFNPTYIPF